jgi:hypothetical protein
MRYLYIGQDIRKYQISLGAGDNSRLFAQSSGRDSRVRDSPPDGKTARDQVFCDSTDN